MLSKFDFDEEKVLLCKNTQIYPNLSIMLKNENLPEKPFWNALKNCFFPNSVRILLNLSYSEKTQKLRIFYFCSSLLQKLRQNCLLEKVAKRRKQAATTMAAETATFRSCYWIEKKMNMLLQETNKIHCCKLLLIP